jgi:hypothetical protein
MVDQTEKFAMEYNLRNYVEVRGEIIFLKSWELNIFAPTEFSHVIA